MAGSHAWHQHYNITRVEISICPLGTPYSSLLSLSHKHCDIRHVYKCLKSVHMMLQMFTKCQNMWPRCFLKSVFMSTRYPIPLPPIPECPSPYYSPSPPPIVMRRTSVSGQHGIVGRALTLPPGDQKANPPPLGFCPGQKIQRSLSLRLLTIPIFWQLVQMTWLSWLNCVHGN